MSDAAYRLALRLLWAAWAVLVFLLFYLYVDAAVSLWMRGAPGWLVALYSVLTVTGEAALWLVPSGAALPIFLFMARRAPPGLEGVRRRRAGVAGFLFGALAASTLVVAVIKRLMGRARPTVFEADGIYGFTFLRLEFDYTSFPSGHAATYLTVALVLAYLRPAWRWWLVGTAVLLAFSRVVLNVHYVSDVMVGGLVAAVTTPLVHAWMVRRGWLVSGARRSG